MFHVCTMVSRCFSLLSLGLCRLNLMKLVACCCLRQVLCECVWIFAGLFVDVKVFFLCRSCVSRIRQTLEKEPTKLYNSFFCRGLLLTAPVTRMSEYKDSPKDVHSSLNEHWRNSHSTCTNYMALSQCHWKKTFTKGQDKMSCL